MKMRTLKDLALVALVVVACQSAPAGLSAQEVRSYGDPITPEGAISTTEFMDRIKGTDSLATKLEAEVITSCVKKGCWMDVKLDNGQVMKVKFKDYGFFVPTQGLEGRHAVLQGYATREVTDVATLRHYAEDAGSSKEEIERITEPREDLFFVADGVLITFQ
jgi:hypothetical protein